MTRTKWLWTSLTVALFLLVSVGTLLAWMGYRQNAPMEVSVSEPRPFVGTIYIEDGVAMPGAFPFTSEDTIGGILAAAGGLQDESDLGRLRLGISSESTAAQKLDINRADAWLLEALPGIGAVLAKRIVDFRQANGPFGNTVDLTKVSGLGKDTYDKIRDFITVGGD